MKKVGIVILNYKVKKFTLECVKSVMKSEYSSYKIFVIDNGSQDGLNKEISKIPRVVFIQNRSNLGYSGGNNIGIREALAWGADFVFVLNPDTKILSDTLKNLVAVSVENNAGIVGPKIYFQDKRIWFAGGIFDQANVLGKHRGVNEEDKGQYQQIQETDFITGAAILIRKDVFESTGFFDERFFLYYEDSDFCFRAKKAGFKILYVPDAVVYHENAKSTGLGSSLQDYYITRNRLLFAFKFLGWRTRFALLREALKNLRNPTRRLALFDFLTGNLHKGRFKIYA